jgi:hypothetical protein
VDLALAAAHRGELTHWPSGDDGLSALLLERIHYHGLAGMLVGVEGWPAPVETAIRKEAVARAMWELRHRQTIARLLKALADADVPALLLKGTAFAYRLYDEPATRTRGDTDLWVTESRLDLARQVLAAEGFLRDEDPDAVAGLQLEEGLVLRDDAGIEHVVDLHWSAVNSAALRRLFEFDSCWERRQPLPRLGPGAFALSDRDALLHSAVHRRMHVASPYLVDGRLFYGGDRLIWALDIDRLVQSLGDQGLADTRAAAGPLGLAPALEEALRLAADRIGTLLQLGPAPAPRTRAAALVASYLASGQVKRALLDLRCLPGLAAKLAAVRRRVVPSRAFLEHKYGAGGLATLLLRRAADFVRTRRHEAAR